MPYPPPALLPIPTRFNSLARAVASLELQDLELLSAEEEQSNQQLLHQVSAAWASPCRAGLHVLGLAITVNSTLPVHGMLQAANSFCLLLLFARAVLPYSIVNFEQCSSSVTELASLCARADWGSSACSGPRAAEVHMQ